MSVTEADALTIPGFDEPFSLELPAPIAALRHRALAVQRRPQGRIVEFPLIDARSWAAHTPDEDWLLWRARRTAERLRGMPFDLEEGERIIGKPLLRQPTDAEKPQLEAASATLASMPPYPGGDAGHFHPDYETLFCVGVGGIGRTIDSRLRDPGLAPDKRTFYEAARIAIEGFGDFIDRAADACEAKAHEDGADAAAWQRQAAICRHVATDPPETFHQAIQLMFLTEIALWHGEDHGLASPGRIDQTLRPFYEADLAAGGITPREAFELIACLFIQMNRILWPGSAVAAMVGGRDHEGRDVTNPLTYLALAARLATKLVYPTVGLAWHEGTPDELTDFGVDVLASGVGCPAFFNDELIANGLRDQGVAEADCHNYMNSTCVEIKVCGASNMWVTQPYYNCPKGLLNVMARVAEGAEAPPDTFDELAERVRTDLANTVRQGAERLDGVWTARGERACFPLASCLIRDCLERGQDFDRGGARYNWVENSFVGLANLADGMLAVKHLVYDTGELSLAEFHQILASDFEGHEDLRQRILNTVPQYGNDNDEADAVAKEWAEFLIDTTESNTVGLHHYVAGFFCWVVHERMGSDTGATPDGRHAGWPLADGAGGSQGREKAGPTASVLSTTKWSHRSVLGGLVHNAKFSGRLFDDERGRKALRSVIETYLRRGGFEMQVNVVSKETLLDAREHPEQYPDLLVRVAGYSDYFVHLNANMQDEIIARTEHAL